MNSEEFSKFIYNFGLPKEVADKFQGMLFLNSP